MQRLTGPAGRRSLVALCVIGLLGLGCVTQPKGPVFDALSPPDPQSTLVYLYRVDTLGGIGAADLQLDGDGLANLQNGEYLAFLLDPGPHSLRARLKWLGIVPRSWSSLDFQARGGQTLYLKVVASYLEVPDPGGPVASPERTGSKPEVGLSLAIMDVDEAQSELVAMRRAKLD